VFCFFAQKHAEIFLVMKILKIPIPVASYRALRNFAPSGTDFRALKPTTGANSLQQAAGN
jgi:hypothetical protein